MNIGLCRGLWQFPPRFLELLAFGFSKGGSFGFGNDIFAGLLLGLDGEIGEVEVVVLVFGGAGVRGCGGARFV